MVVPPRWGVRVGYRQSYGPQFEITNCGPFLYLKNGICSGILGLFRAIGRWMSAPFSRADLVAAIVSEGRAS